MHRAHTYRIASVIFAGVLTIAASVTATAQFVAGHPGGDLEPVGTAAQYVSLIQGQEHILWTSTSGTVTSITVRGWPVSDGEVELGGAMSITRPDRGDAGVIDFGERPMSASFEIAD